MTTSPTPISSGSTGRVTTIVPAGSVGSIDEVRITYGVSACFARTAAARPRCTHPVSASTIPPRVLVNGPATAKNQVAPSCPVATKSTITPVPRRRWLRCVIANPASTNVASASAVAVSGSIASWGGVAVDSVTRCRASSTYCGSRS